MRALRGLVPIRQALKSENFAIYTAGNSVSLIGTWLQRTSVGWLAWDLTHSGAWLGLIAFADLFPTVLLAPVAGAVADRRNRMAVTRSTQLIMGGQAAMLCVLTALGLINIFLLFGLTIVLGAAAAFNQPARIAMVPELVDRAHVNAAVAVNSIIFNLARFIGPAVAGALILASGTALAFGVNALTFGFFYWCLSRVRLAPTARRAAVAGSFAAEIADGLRYTLAHGGIFATFILLTVSAITCRPVVELLAGFAEEVFRSGPDGLAILTSSISVGAVAAGLAIGVGAQPRTLFRKLLQSTLILALGAAFFAATDIFWIAVPAMVVLGYGLSHTGIAAQTLIHLSVSEAMRGRVLSIYSMIFRGGPAVGALLMGVASERYGLRTPVVAGALMMLGVWLCAFARRDRIAGHF
jgi:predicted MFS family arabinose efflux permease